MRYFAFMAYRAPAKTSSTLMLSVIVLASAGAAAIVAHVYYALDAIPQLFELSVRQPTIALALALLAGAAVAVGASAACVWRVLTVGQRVAVLIPSILLLITAWAFHQALWHLAFGRGHAGPSWFGQ